MASCSTCGTPLPESFYGYTCNACKLIELQKDQIELQKNHNNPYSGGGGGIQKLGIVLNIK